MNSVEASAATIDEAVELALLQLGESRENVELEVLENPSRGLLGLLGGRAARVRATRISRPVEEEPVSDSAMLPSFPASDEQAPADARGVELRAVELLASIVDRIGVTATVSSRSNDEGMLLEISGDASGLLIGRHGQMLDALEYVINRALLRDDEKAPRVVVDANNYRSRRRASLEELAQRMAEQAKCKGQPVSLNPMPPQDRRIIHMFLQNDSELTTQSSGTGILRRLVIIPQGATFNPGDVD